MTELGARLKEAREAKGYSLEDLQRVTKIQKRYLIGIEEGNYDLIPGKFYVRAFIKQYAESVGLSPEIIFEEYKNDIPASFNDDIPEQLSRVRTRKTVPQSSSKAFDIIPKLLVAIFVIGALFVIWLVVSNYLGNDKNNGETNEDRSPVQVDQNKDADKNKKANENSNEQNETAKGDTNQTEMPEEKSETQKPELSVVESSGIQTTYELKNAEEFKLDLATSGDSWIEVYNSKGEQLSYGMMTDGGSKSIDLKDDPEASLIIGNASNTEIKVNGTVLQYEISPTEVVRQNITIQFSKSE
ncbi:cytoskeletal protein RodZ [Bacillus pakistanensis]|uniref:Cytoskeletal protein RodZ n=1 Tax=Rossellomorea pakistanensis TaxID=992288 RepID=A0ABS2NGE6_9BACI|nr:RodZ domain-containing protein [Bacillus pakistanensis]MBM7586904.1 cytoskeletal protein RodZ [Bacillus pakistanensis]